MPKLFEISVQVEEIALGKVMHLLHRTPGVANVALQLGDTKPHKGNGVHKPKKVFDQTGNDFVMGLLAKGPMTRQAIAQAFHKAGRSPNSINSIMHEAKINGLMFIKGKDWSLTAKGKNKLEKQS